MGRLIFGFSVFLYSLSVTDSFAHAEPGRVGFILFDRSKNAKGDDILQLQIRSHASDEMLKSPTPYQSCFEYDDLVWQHKKEIDGDDDNLIVHRVFCQIDIAKSGFQLPAPLTRESLIQIAFGDSYDGAALYKPDGSLRIRGKAAKELAKLIDGVENPPVQCEVRRFRSPTRGGGMRHFKELVCDFKIPTSEPRDESHQPFERVPEATP